MSVVNRGVRNSFRNRIRTLSIVLILSLSIGLALSMLLAHKAVDQKIQSVKSSAGTDITISPAGFSGFNQVSNSLTTSQLDKVKPINHVTSLVETLDDRLTTTGTVSGPGGESGSNTTSLKSPIKLNNNGNGTFSGGGFGISIRGRDGNGASLPSNFSLPIPVIGTTDPTSLRGNTVTLTSGNIIDGTKDSDKAMISKDMASKNSLKVGSTFTAYGAKITVAGIFDSGTRGGNDTVVMPLPTLQRLSGNSGDVTGATATVDSIDNLSSTTSAIKKALGSSADVQSSLDQANNTIQPLENIRSVSVYSLIGAVVAGAVIVLLTMIMIVRERQREIGVLKAIGASNLRVVFQFISEAVTFTLLAAVIGIVIGVAAANPITRTLVNNSSSNSSNFDRGGGPVTFSSGPGGTASAGGPGPSFVRSGRGLGVFRSNLTNIHAAVGWSSILYGLGAALVIAIAGSSAAAWFIARVRPAEVMRSE